MQNAINVQLPSDNAAEWERIRNVLEHDQIQNIAQLIDVINSCSNTEADNQQEFQSLKYYIDRMNERESDDFFGSILPAIIRFALALPQIVLAP